MAIISISIKNGEKIMRALEKAPTIMVREINKAIQKSALFTVGEVKKHITSGTDMYKSPVLTGALRRGISVSQLSPMKATITPSKSTDYAKYVHEGTSKMQARPFFNITAKRSQKDIEDFFNKALDTAIKQAFK